MKKLAKFTFFTAILAGVALLFSFFAKYLADQNTELKSLLSNNDLPANDHDTFDANSDAYVESEAE